MSNDTAMPRPSGRTRRRAAIDALREEMGARPEQVRLAWRPEEFAAAVGVPLASVRSWLSDYVESRGRSGLPHTRPMPHTILIWSDDVAAWRRATGALRRAGRATDFGLQNISGSETLEDRQDDGADAAGQAGA